MPFSGQVSLLSQLLSLDCVTNNCLTNDCLTNQFINCVKQSKLASNSHHTTIHHRSVFLTLTTLSFTLTRQIGYSPISLLTTLDDLVPLQKVISIIYLFLWLTLSLPLLNLPFESWKVCLPLFEYLNPVLLSNCMFPSDNYLISTVFSLKQCFP